jgi:hypothetical protein
LSGDVGSEQVVREHEERLKILEERNGESSSQFKYMWLNSTCHDYLLPTFQVSPMFLPTVVIYSPTQKKYARLVKPFSKENLQDFEKSFEGRGNMRIIVEDMQGDISGLLKEIYCPNVQPQEEVVTEEMMLDKELEDEIMREILEEEERRKKELELDEPKRHKKKKGKKKKGKN